MLSWHTFIPQQMIARCGKVLHNDHLLHVAKTLYLPTYILWLLLNNKFNNTPSVHVVKMMLPYPNFLVVEVEWAVLVGVKSLKFGSYDRQ